MDRFRERIRRRAGTIFLLGGKMPRSSVSKKKRRLNRSIKISSEVYERLLSLQGFLQLKEKQKRSMDELIEFILTYLPSMEISADENYYVLDSKAKRKAA